MPDFISFDDKTEALSCTSGQRLPAIEKTAGVQSALASQQVIDNFLMSFTPSSGSSAIDVEPI